MPKPTHMRSGLCLFFTIIFSYLSAQKPELVIQREGHTAEVTQVCFSPDERQVLSGGRDRRLVLWDLYSRKFIRFVQLDTTPAFLSFGSKGQTAVAILADNSLNAWSLVDGKRIWRVQPDRYQSLTQRGDSLFLTHLDNTTSCWDLATGKKRWQQVSKARQQPTTPPHPPGLSEKLAALGKGKIQKIEYSRNERIAVVALGTPTVLSMVTPGQPAFRKGYGGLLVWDLSKDTLAFPIIDLPEMVSAITLSADGTRCLSASFDRTVRLWDLYSGKELIRLEREPSLQTQFSFSPDFRQVAFSRLDNTLKTFNLDQRNSLVTLQKDKQINTFRFTPDGKDLLVANRTGSIVRIIGLAPDGLLQFKPDQHMEVMHSLSFSPDGRKLLTGSTKEPRAMYITLKQIRRKDIDQFIVNDQKDTIGFETPTGKVYGKLSSRQNPVSYQPNVNVNAIWDLEKGEIEQVLYPYEYKGWIYAMQTAFSPDGNIALGKTAGKWNAWNAKTGNLIRNQEGNKVFSAFYFDGQGGHALSILSDGRLSKWNLENGEIEKNYSGFGQSIAAAFNTTGEKGLILAEDGVLREWDTQSGAIIRQIPTGLPRTAVELQYTPDENIVLVKSQGNADLWDLRNGKPLLQLGQGKNVLFAGDQFWDGHTPDQISLFEFLPDDITAVSATYSGTLKFWNFRTGLELCSVLFLSQNDWVVTTPSGLFDASKGALQTMYFRLGTEILELEQLKERYFEPGLLQKLLGFAPGGLRPVEELNNLALYPRIKRASIEADRIKVQLQARNGGIGKVALLLNDKIELEPNVNPGFKPNFEIDLRRFDAYFFPDSINRLSLRAYNQDGWLKGPPYPIFYNPSGAKGTQDNSPLTPLGAKNTAKLDSINLYALVVGTSTFRGSQLNLKYPDKDAAAFAEALKAAGTPLFGKNMEIKLLTTNTQPYPRKAVIAKALADIAAKSDPNDILLVYFSGHGITYPANSEKGQFYYLTTDILSDKLDDPNVLKTQTIGQDTLQKWIRKVKALKRILILDACNSGQVVQSLQPGEKALNSDQRRALERMNDRSGMFVLAGSAADKSSYETSRFGHGLLTYSLLNNMPFVAAANKTFIDVGKLFSNAMEEVPRLALDIGKVQKPEMIATESFDIGIIDSKVKFTIPQSLPVFVRTVFMDSRQNKDLLRLSKAVNSNLEEQAAFKEPSLVYWDIDEFSANHYYLGGLYEVTGNVITGKATLYRKDEVLLNFPFSGQKDQLKSLAEEITNQAFERINKLN